MQGHYESLQVTKLESTSLLFAGHDSPLDITVWMDSSRNPESISEIIFNGWNQLQCSNLHTQAQTKTTTILNNGPGMLFNIPSLLSMRPSHLRVT